MENKLSSLPLTLLTAVLAALGGVLRALERSGSGVTALIVCSAAVAVLALVLSRSMPRERDHARIFGGKNAVELALSLVGAALMLAGCFASAAAGGGAERYIAILGAVSMLALVRAAALRWQGRKPSAGWFLPTLAYFFAKLFCDYRQWMLDPQIADYCWLLFALLCFLSALYCAAAFSYDRGSRRALVFFSMTGVYFGAVSAVGAGLSQALVYAGGAVYLLGTLWQAATVKEPAAPAPDDPMKGGAEA